MAYFGRLRRCMPVAARLRAIRSESTLPRGAGQEPQLTNFGFKEVPPEEKTRLVGNVFSSVASRYDLMNDLMSGGLHRLWKNRLVAKLLPFPGMQHLDVAGGTGDVAFRVLDSIHQVEQKSYNQSGEDGGLEEEATRVYVCDINRSMLEVGKERARDRGYGNTSSLVWMEGDAEALDMKDASVDGYTIAFGIRNVTRIDKALKEAHRVLRRGGRFLCLELSHVDPLIKPVYDFYSFSVIPAVGQLVTGDRASYQYLVESIRKFPTQDTFAEMISAAGFQDVQYENLAGGVVAIHSGLKL